MAFLGVGRQECFGNGQDDAQVGDGVNVEVVLAEGEGIDFAEGHDPVVGVVVSEWVGGGVRGQVKGRGVGSGAHVGGDVACEVLEYTGGLGFPKETCGEVVEGVVPPDDHVGGEGVVEFELVESGGHVSFGEVDVGGEQLEKVVDAFVLDVSVEGGEVDVAGVHEEAEFIRFLFEGQGKYGDGGAPTGNTGVVVGEEDLGAAKGVNFRGYNGGLGVGGGVVGEVAGFRGRCPLGAVSLGEQDADVGGGARGSKLGDGLGEDGSLGAPALGVATMWGSRSGLKRRS